MEAFAQLAQLSQLTELRLTNFAINLALEAPIQPCPSVRVLCLKDISLLDTDPVDVHFFRIRSAMFPNLRKLHLGPFEVI